jgi:FAD/FMN-containing dehydrogenase
MADLSELSIDGRVVTPDDSDWDEARQAWNLIADQHPVAVAIVAGAGDVATVVRFAAEQGLRVTAQGTGHGAAALGPLDDTILIKTTQMRGIEIDPDAGTARLEAGVEGSELGEAAQAHGMCSMPGSSPNVGVVGYTLGGGLSLGRCRTSIGMPMTPELGQALPGALDALVGAMEPWAADGGYYNFAERACEVDAILPGDTCSRLAEVKRAWDPDDLFLANHSLAAAAV